MDTNLPAHAQEVACKVTSFGESEGEGGSGRHGRSVCMSIASSQPAAWRTPNTPQQLATRVESLKSPSSSTAASSSSVELPESVRGREVWKLRSDDVVALTQGQLRELLRREGVPSRRGNTVEELLAKLAPMMDEVSASLSPCAGLGFKV